MCGILQVIGFITARESKLIDSALKNFHPECKAGTKLPRLRCKIGNVVIIFLNNIPIFIGQPLKGTNCLFSDTGEIQYSNF